MRSDQVHIDSPCHESWDAMEGGAERRYCGVCQKHVHNLSAMNLDDARALLRDSAGDSLCVRYAAEADGTLRFRDLVPRARLTRGLVRTAFAASILAACGAQERAPVVDVGQAVIASLPDFDPPAPGCDITPSPLVTFHLPPGLCALTGDDAADLPPTTFAPPPPAPFAPPPRVAIAAPPPVAPIQPYTGVPAYAAPLEPDRLPARPVYAPPPPPNPGFAPPPPPSGPGFAPPPPPRPYPDFAPPPPPPNPFPGTGPGPRFTPPPPPPPQPPPEPLMGSIALPEPERMGRIAPSR